MASTVAKTPETLGQKIRWARKRSGLSLDRLGGLVGTSRQHLIRLEADRHVPRAELIERIAVATGQDPAFFGQSAEAQRIALARQSAQIDAARDLMAALMRVVQLYEGGGAE